MPWLNSVDAVLEAWYPGTSGGEAIARVLFGDVNPSGHLPVTFPVSVNQLPRPNLDSGANFAVNYGVEGAAVGYKWFDAKGIVPLFPFGHGLSYTQFSYSTPTATLVNGEVNVSFNVTNTGTVKGKDVPQVYVSPSSTQWEAPKRLGAFDKVELVPGETKTIKLAIDPRLLGMYQTNTKTWQIAGGIYNFSVARNAGEVSANKVTLNLPARSLNLQGK